MIKSYKDLIVWQKAINLSLEIYEATKVFPKEEIYGITSQMRRSSISIPSNIAEGSTRQSKLEYIQFLYIAISSGAELETQLLIANNLKYLSAQKFDHLNNYLGEIMKMLNVLILKLKASP